MTDVLDSAALRRWAMHIAAQADAPRITGDERERLLKMRTALLELAHTQDWLAQDWLEGQQRDLRPTG